MNLSAYAQEPSLLRASDNRGQARDNAQTEIILHEELIGDMDSVSPWMVMDQVLVTTGVVDPDGCGLGFPGLGGPALGVTRDPTTGRVDCVDSGFGNAGKRFVEGLNVTAVYELPTERFGKFTFSGGWNHFFSWKAQPGLGSTDISFLGNYDNATLPFAPGAIPWNKGFLRGEWEWRHFDFIATSNYIGDFRDDPAFDNFNYARGGRRTVSSYITLDMQLSHEFVRPAAEPIPAPKDAKDSGNVIWSACTMPSIAVRLTMTPRFTPSETVITTSPSIRSFENTTGRERCLSNRRERDCLHCTNCD